ncbi:MAG: TIGR01777 family oxidoreductase [Pseudobdellovibrio sp.]
MNILMTGGTGFIGRELGFLLVNSGHKLKIVTRNAASAKEKLTFNCETIERDLNSEPLIASDFADIDAIINLAGETIDGRWTTQKKTHILESRKQSAKNLLLNCPEAVKTIVTVSAQGYYGDRGQEDLDENSKKGEGFLAEVCEAWEKPFLEIQNKRVVILRLGLVLSKKGGALRKMLPIFQNNLGAQFGDGEQWMSFISLKDLVRLFADAVEDKAFRGIYNAVNNHPIQNKDFTKILADTLGVWQMPAVPKFVLKILLGEMSELILSSLKLYSFRIKQTEFEFKDVDLASYLEKELQS